MFLLNFKNFYILLIATILSIFFIDKNLAILIHDHGIDNIRFLKMFSDFLPYAIFLLAVFYIFNNKPTQLFSNRFSALLYLGFSLLLAMIFKSIFKYIFARVRPMSFFEDNLYGFYFFNKANIQANFPDGHSMFSFPSGHTTFVAIIAITIAMAYPKSKMKLVCFITTMLMIISLIALNYHFLGDCLAALTLVSIMSIVTLILYRFLIFIFIYKFLFKIFMNKLNQRKK